MVVTYELQPGEGLDQFRLGDSLKKVLDALVGNTFFFPKVEISWDEDQSHKSPVTVHLPQPNITLFFPAPDQILTLISVPIPSTVRLRCGSELLCGEGSSLTRSRVGQVLGPTYATGSTSMKYPGVIFTLSGSSGRDDLVEKIEIVPRDPLGRPEPRAPIREVMLLPGRGATVRMVDHDVELVLGDTTGQDLRLELGSPTHTYWKEDDRMERIWAGQDKPKGEDERLSCFYTYRHLGLDFLLDSDRVLVKIIAHSNIPGTALFHRYERCPWSIQSAHGPLTSSSPLSLFRSSLQSAPAQGSEPASRLDVPVAARPGNSSAAAGSTRHKKRSGSDNSAVSVGSSESTGSNSKVLGEKDIRTAPCRAAASEPPGDDAMLLDRLGEQGMAGVKNISPSRLVGLEGVVLEEDERSGGICSVLVYKV